MSESQRGASGANESRDDLIRNTQSGRRDADEIDTTPASSGGGADTASPATMAPGGNLIGPGKGLPDPLNAENESANDSEV